MLKLVQIAYTKVIGVRERGGGSQNSYTRTDPKVGGGN